MKPLTIWMLVAIAVLAAFAAREAYDMGVRAAPEVAAAIRQGDAEIGAMLRQHATPTTFEGVCTAIMDLSAEYLAREGARAEDAARAARDDALR